MFKKIKDKIHNIRHNEELKAWLYSTIFEDDTPIGKAFNIVLMICIIISTILIFVESRLKVLFPEYTIYFIAAELFFTAFFTIEYILRLYCSPNSLKYALSFYGIVDLISILPVYISWFFGPSRYFMVIRIFRLIRVFRVFKLFSFINEGNTLLKAMIDSRRKIVVFFLFITVMVISIGTVMYMIEGPRYDQYGRQTNETDFVDVPTSIYWATVTLTTVGYGDISPKTNFGRFLSVLVMLLGYTVIAVPTGIVSASMIRETQKKKKYFCEHCGAEYTNVNAKFCQNCGFRLPNNELKEFS